jgi:hypothetical protein
LAAGRTIIWRNMRTIIALFFLVGTEFVGAAWAAGWALGGMFQLGPTLSHVCEITFALLGLVALYYFLRTAIRHEPIFD